MWVRPAVSSETVDFGENLPRQLRRRRVFGAVDERRAVRIGASLHGGERAVRRSCVDVRRHFCLDFVAPFLPLACLLARQLGAAARFGRGDVQWLAAGGDPSQIEQAKGNLKSALLGYALTVLAPILLTILQSILGI